MVLIVAYIIVLLQQGHDPVVKHSVHTLVFRSLKRSHDMFLAHEGQSVPENELAYVCWPQHYLQNSSTILLLPFPRLKQKVACKVRSEHGVVKDSVVISRTGPGKHA